MVSNFFAFSKGILKGLIPDDIEQRRLDKNFKGVVLTDISPKSTLSFLLSPGDIIVEIQGKVIGNTNDLIRAAKDIILKRMTDPPSLDELASEIGLSLKKLKDGFKQIYGDTVFAYLLDHKMDEARKMLESQKYNVNEVGLKLGYSTSSHFINAFKKKYGTTPKKYLGSVSS